jgi:D-3-phosphoglycerate dehydrogenase
VILAILEPEHFSEAVAWKLADSGFIVNSSGKPTEQTEVLWARLGKVDIDRYPNVKLIACNCTDVSHLPLEECQRRGIEVLSLKGIEGLDNVHATAEHTISLMLQALRHRCDRSSGRIGRELYDKRVGLVGGKGRIGKKVTRLLLDFGANVGYPPRDSNAWNNTYDIVSIHADLNETSRGMVNAEFLSKLKPGAIVVNTARDAIVDRDAICDWLDNDQEAIYAHDFADEWALLEASLAVLKRPGRKQIISTPHIGGWTIESLHKTEELLAEKVIEWARIQETGFCEVAPVNGCRAWKDASGRTYIEGP